MHEFWPFWFIVLIIPVIIIIVVGICGLSCCLHSKGKTPGFVINSKPVSVITSNGIRQKYLRPPSDMCRNKHIPSYIQEIQPTSGLPPSYEEVQNSTNYLQDIRTSTASDATTSYARVKNSSPSFRTVHKTICTPASYLNQHRVTRPIKGNVSGTTNALYPSNEGPSRSSQSFKEVKITLQGQKFYFD